MYELRDPKEADENEWMYQITVAPSTTDPLAAWGECWEALVGPCLRPSPRPGQSPRSRPGSAVQPDYEEALACLRRHLGQSPADPAATWLQDVLRGRQTGTPAGGCIERAGQLEYRVRYTTNTSGPPAP